MMEIELNPGITVLSDEIKKHPQASEEYIEVGFSYGNGDWEGWVPIEYRRTGVSIKPDEKGRIAKYLNDVYKQMNPEKFPIWLEIQEDFWKNEHPRANVTKSFFDCLAEGGWKCMSCTLPKNPNPTRRIQELKDWGYTIATDTKRFCPTCGKNKTHIMLLPIERCEIKGNGYETISLNLKKRIKRVLGEIDAYENKPSKYCLPDHKFSEIRWDENTKNENPDDMTDDEIRSKFQLLTNQRNQQKREVCRNCYQTGKRGVIYGIPFYYNGGETWDESIPPKGKEAERGCIGCPWYDIMEWRKKLLSKLSSN